MQQHSHGRDCIDVQGAGRHCTGLYTPKCDTGSNLLRACPAPDAAACAGPHACLYACLPACLPDLQHCCCCCCAEALQVFTVLKQLHISLTVGQLTDAAGNLGQPRTGRPGWEQRGSNRHSELQRRSTVAQAAGISRQHRSCSASNADKLPGPPPSQANCILLRPP